jgi:GT2 family glycosyltransferase
MHNDEESTKKQFAAPLDVKSVESCDQQQVLISSRELQDLKDRIAELEGSLAAKEFTIQSIQSSRGWRLLNAYRGVRNRLLRFPAMSMLARLSKTSSRKAYDYGKWLQIQESTDWNPDVVKAALVGFHYRPTISILMPVHDASEEHLKSAIESVSRQIYDAWELCICDDASTKDYVQPFLQSLSKQDARIKVAISEHSGGISTATNCALDLATGEFVGLLDHDDELSPMALYETVKLLQEHPEADYIYSDEDKLEADGGHSEPFFKPDWSPEYMLCCMYTCHFSVYRRSQVVGVGGLRSQFDGSQDYDLALRVSERTKNIFHLPKILYHWRKTPSSTASSGDAKDYTTVAGLNALKEHAQRIGRAAKVTSTGIPNRFRVQPEIIGEPLVSIIIPTKDRIPVLKRCLESLEAKTTYPNYEVLIVNNNSTRPGTEKFLRSLHHRVISFNEPFNYSRINNFAVREARGGFLVFLNNDTEVISPGWLQAMLEFCQLPDVGVVGAKLYYPNGKVQHAGVVLGIGGVAGHSHKFFSNKSRGYFDSLVCVRNYSAVTAACMMVRRDIFGFVDGFDEQLRVAFNDVDFCLRVREKGFRIVWTPYAELFHHESTTRGSALDASEIERMKRRWGNSLLRDPYYNPNLTLRYEDFSLRF